MFGLQMIHEMDSVQREMEQLFRGLGFEAANRNLQQASQFEVKDLGDAFEVKAVLPGLEVAKVEINVLGRRLTLAGEFAHSEIPEGVIWHRRERASGRFEKSFQLATNVEAEQVVAEYQEGVLRIKLPKAASALPKKISIKSA